MTPLLQVKNLSVTFGNGSKTFHAVKNVSFNLMEGENFGIVGESGSGKTTIGRTIIRIYPASSGEVWYDGQRISGKISKKLNQKVTQEIQMIFQDPMASLNERAKIDYIVSEGLLGQRLSQDEIHSRVDQAMRDVGLLPEFASRFPHEFSGGQRQRIGIARALVMNPRLIIADEPISALDVSIRAQVLNLMRQLQVSRGLTYLFISHDLSVMQYICDRIAVMYHGRIVEMADTETLYRHPMHPYTKSLLSAIPLPSPRLARNKQILPYEFYCESSQSNDCPLEEITPGHWVAVSAAEREQLLANAT